MVRSRWSPSALVHVPPWFTVSSTCQERNSLVTHALWSDSTGIPYSVLHQAPMSLFSLLCIKNGDNCMMVIETLPDPLIQSFLWLRSYTHFELLLPPPNWTLCSNLLSHLIQILHWQDVSIHSSLGRRTSVNEKGVTVRKAAVGWHRLWGYLTRGRWHLIA